MEIKQQILLTGIQFLYTFLRQINFPKQRILSLHDTQFIQLWQKSPCTVFLYLSTDDRQKSFYYSKLGRPQQNNLKPLISSIFSHNRTFKIPTLIAASPRSRRRSKAQLQERRNSFPLIEIVQKPRRLLP